LVSCISKNPGIFATVYKIRNAPLGPLIWEVECLKKISAGVTLHEPELSDCLMELVQVLGIHDLKRSQKRQEYNPVQLKTSHLTIKIIFPWPESRETIPFKYYHAQVYKILNIFPGGSYLLLLVPDTLIHYNI
jgi:hypothetical protein